MKRKKKCGALLGLALAVVLAVGVITACGKKNDTQSTGGAGTTAETTAGTTAAPGTAEDETEEKATTEPAHSTEEGTDADGDGILDKMEEGAEDVKDGIDDVLTGTEEATVGSRER